ncbi:alpha/beta fold hydrolase [Pusillimonas sp.]|uniref:alpha/beta fold hydrolase n=1 Tax=Pusillimonas sp. TaxID=3040095 RepID=UPI0037C7FA60
MKAPDIFLACAAALVLAGCGGSGGGGGGGGGDEPPDPLAAYKNQTVAWGSCKQYFNGNDAASTLLAKLGSRVKCADVKAPLDYQNPDGLRISVSMLRVEAADSSETKPNLFFNPGGPGGDGQTLSLYFYGLLSGGNRESVLGRKYVELSEAYNFVGFSPRGVGASTTVACSGNELIYQIDTTKWGDEPQNLQKIADLARYTAGNCQKNPLAHHIHTDATARDMDLMRHLLGDEKLHYHGTSYGTWLGFWYAGTFPDRVGPMVLDSNANFTKTLHEAFIHYRLGQIHSFKAFMAPYMARHDSVFHMGVDAETVIGNLAGMNHEVNLGLFDISNAFRVEPQLIRSYVGSVKAAIETQKLLAQGKSLDDIRAELTSGRHIDDDLFDAAFKRQASNLIERMEVHADPLFYTRSEPFKLDAEDAVWQLVVCNDEPMPNKDEAFWVAKGFELANLAPIADNMVASQPCLHWDRIEQSTRKPTTASLKDAQVLMMQTEFDVPTPLEGAMETFEALPAASMVYLRGEGAHGVLVHQTECVDLAMMDYLLGKAPARRLTECEGRTLPLDPAPPPEDSALSARAVSVKSVSNFEDPALAEELLDRLKEAVAP